MSDQYQVSARKYRPLNFHSVVGQQNLTATLKGAIQSDRLAHAYLFCGPRGVGKTTCARIFARTINCLNPTADGEACGECESCRAISRGNSYNLMELDAASNNSVNDIRTITEQVNVPPQVGKYRVFIIDEVHMLSSAAFNAFLKTLEEPPSYVIFILATTEKHKVIPTILSRCQIYDFKRITINDIVDHLAYVAGNEGITADRKALGVIARKADGAMRDALSIFDQVATSTHRNMTYDAVVESLNVLDYDYFFRMVATFANGDAPAALLLYRDIRDRGFDSLFFINSLAQHVRDLMVAADPRTVSLLETPDDVAARLVEQAGSLPLQWYYAAMQLLNDCDLNYRTSSNKQLLVELTLIRLCQLMNPAQPPFDLSARKAPLRDPSELPGGAQSSAVTAVTAVAAVSDTEGFTPAAAAKTVQPKSAVTSSVRNDASAVVAAAVGTSVSSRARRPKSFRVSETDSAITDNHTQRNEPFSDDQFAEAIAALVPRMDEHPILASALRVANPVRRSETEFEMTAVNKAQISDYETHMMEIVSFLRDQLRNDFVTIRPVLRQERETVRLLSPQEFLKKAISENKTLGNFLNGMNFEMA